MQIFRWLLAGWVGLMGCVAMAPAHATVETLDQARVELIIDGQWSTAEVNLPYGWDQHHKGLSGLARFTLHFDGPATMDAPWALYFYRLGNAYEVALNGIVLEQKGTLERTDSSDYSKVPRLVHVPSNVLQQHNQLQITIRSDSGRRSGMPAVWVGPENELEPSYRHDYAVRVDGSVALTVFSLIVGVFAAVLWLTQIDPRPDEHNARDQLYLFAALAEFSWAFFLGDTLIEKTPLPWDWWSVVMNMALGIWMASLLMFCHRVAGWGQHWSSQWARRSLQALILIGPIVAFAAVNGSMPQLLTAWQACFAVVFVPSTVLFVAHATRKASTMHRLVALAFLINVPVGLHDFYVMRIADPFTGQALLRYSATLFGLVLGAIAIDRFRRANINVRDMLQTQASRIEKKEQELAQTYRQLEQVAREQERTQERSRILRDMHDGVGSHISSAIRQLQSGPVNHDEVLRTLRDSMDQLKLSIDSLNLPPGDVNALLANLRYRLEPRFRAMGLALEWAVVPLAPRSQLDTGSMRQLQYIIFEALSNVMQHSHASVLRIEAMPGPQAQGSSGRAIQIRICDNGCGFDTAAPWTQGLLAMQDRALVIRAQLNIVSQPGGTCVDLLLG